MRRLWSADRVSPTARRAEVTRTRTRRPFTSSISISWSTFPPSLELFCSVVADDVRVRDGHLHETLLQEVFENVRVKPADRLKRCVLHALEVLDVRVADSRVSHSSPRTPDARVHALHT